MIRNITISELLRIPSANIIDIREVENYNSNHIPGAHNIPMNKLITEPEKYLNYNTTYYIYCQRGVKSVDVVKLLTRKGYRVVNIVGGYESWILEA